MSAAHEHVWTRASGPGRARLWHMRKPLKCLLLGHDWRWKWNDEGQKYEECDRCGANRDRGSDNVGAAS